MNKLPYLLIGGGLLIMALGLSGILFLSTTFISYIESQAMELKNFLNIHHSNQMRIYLYNVTGTEGLLRGDLPLKVQEIGPFTFQINKSRSGYPTPTGLSFLYMDTNMYSYDEAASNCRLQLDDKVTQINVPWVSLAQQSGNVSMQSRAMMTGIVSRYKESIIIRKSIEEMLFKGYHQNLLAAFSVITGEEYLPNNTFGYFYGRNETPSVPREMSINPSSYGETLSYAGMTSFPPEEESKTKGSCGGGGELGGTDWDIFPPSLSKGQHLRIFSPELCKTIELDFDSEIQFQGLIKGYRYVMGARNFHNDDKGCSPSELPNGAYYVSGCSKGAPLLISPPHFYQGSEIYREKVLLKPGIKEEHETFVDVEPITGILLQYKKRFQTNIHLRAVRMISEFKKLPDVIFPLFWTDENAMIKPEVLMGLEMLLGAQSRIPPLYILSVTVLVAGFVLLVTGILILCLQLRKKSYVI